MMKTRTCTTAPNANSRWQQELLVLIFELKGWLINMKSPGSMIKMPDSIDIRNASTERCDAASGPCSCGAWHKLSDWPKEVQKVVIQMEEHENI